MVDNFAFFLNYTTVSHASDWIMIFPQSVSERWRQTSVVEHIAVQFLVFIILGMSQLLCFIAVL